MLSGKDQAVEFLMIGLRVAGGVDLRRFQNLAGYPIPEARIDELVDLGLLKASKTSISLSNQGFSLLNGVLRTLLSD